MANVSILCKYCSLFIIFSCLCFLPLCHTGKMRKKPKNDRILRSIKKLDKRYSRRVQAAESLEEFVKLFRSKSEVVDGTGKHFLERTSLYASPDERARTLQLDESYNMSYAMERVWASTLASSCSEPKPVLLDSYDTIGIGKGRLKYIQPSCLQVNRCGQHSGCCSETELCTVKAGSIRNATRQVLIGTIIIASSGERWGEVAAYTTHIEEHTECECRTNPNCSNLKCEGPKTKDPARCACTCPRRCPTPYIPDEETCECVCGVRNRTDSYKACRSIFLGKAAMLANECECVRSKQCSQPECRTRHQFDNATCSCVRQPSTAERIADTLTDEYEETLLFPGEMEVRGMAHEARPSGTPPGEGGVGLIPVVRSMDQQLPTNLKEGVPVVGSGKANKLGRLTPDTNEYRPSSHTTYNDTLEGGPQYNSSRKSTKSKIAPWEDSGDELNATFIREESPLEASSNDTVNAGTASDTVIPGEADGNELTDTRLEKPEKPPLEDGKNDINTFKPDPGTDDTEDSYRENFLSSSSEFSYESSYSSLNGGNMKYETYLEFDFENVNADQENYEFEGSGDTNLGGY